jgi:hypothetical protein
MSMDDADLTRRENPKTSTSEDVVAELRSLRQEFNLRVQPTRELDPITERVRINTVLKRIVGHFYLEPANILDQLEIGIIKDLDYIRHRRGREDTAEEGPVKKENAG